MGVASGQRPASQALGGIQVHTRPAPTARSRLVVAVGMILLIAGCGAGSGAATLAPTAANADPTTPTAAPTAATPAPTDAGSPATAMTQEPSCAPPQGSVPDVFSIPGEFPELEPTTYSVDPDFDDCTSLRVLFTVPGPGWLQWFGSFKPDGDDRRVGVSIVDVTNLVADGCKDHLLADPAVGRGVDDLAVALAELAPFEVTSPPSDVRVHGYRGKYLEWQLPASTDLTKCVNGEVISWDATILSYPFHGYFLGMIEEFWILDVDGTRLVIAANRAPDSSPADVAEMRALLDSIEIQP